MSTPGHAIAGPAGDATYLEQLGGGVVHASHVITEHGALASACTKSKTHSITEIRHVARYMQAVREDTQHSTRDSVMMQE